MGKNLKYIIDHVFLLLKLPQKDDSNATKGAALVKEALTALQLLQAHSDTRALRMDPLHQDGRQDSPDTRPFWRIIGRKSGNMLRGMFDGGTNIQALGTKQKLTSFALT